MAFLGNFYQQIESKPKQMVIDAAVHYLKLYRAYSEKALRPQNLLKESFSASSPSDFSADFSADFHLFEKSSTANHKSLNETKNLHETDLYEAKNLNFSKNSSNTHHTVNHHTVNYHTVNYHTVNYHTENHQETNLNETKSLNETGFNKISLNSSKNSEKFSPTSFHSLKKSSITHDALTHQETHFKKIKDLNMAYHSVDLNSRSGKTEKLPLERLMLTVQELTIKVDSLMILQQSLKKPILTKFFPPVPI